MRRIVVILAIALQIALQGCATTPYSKEIRTASIAALRAQGAEARRRVDTTDQPVSAVYAGFALSSASPAFLGDILTGKELAKRLGSEGASLTLSNGQAIDNAVLPFATEDDMADGIAETAKLVEYIQKRQSARPLVVILITSHGNQQLLSVQTKNTQRVIYSHTLSRALRPVEPYPTLLIVSACYSGSLIPALAHKNRIIITASSSERSSFGCSTSDSRTWFVDALFQSFDPKSSTTEWFQKTSETVRLREEKHKYMASEPQIWIGTEMTELSKTPLEKLRKSQTTEHLSSAQPY